MQTTRRLPDDRHQVASLFRATSLALLTLASPALVVAGQNQVAVYHFGDVDAGAAAGAAIHNPTVDLRGGRHLPRLGDPTYTSDTPNPSENSLAAALDGVDDYFYIRNLPTTRVEGFMIEAWVKPATDTGFQWIVYNGVPGVNGYGIARAGNRFWAFLGPTQQLLGGHVVVDQWTQLALVQFDGEVGMYTDDGRWSAANGPAPSAPEPGQQAAFSIGAGPGGVAPFEGMIDEVRVSHLDPSSTNPRFNIAGVGFRPLEPGVARYHLGDADPGAAPGAIGEDPTVDSAGAVPLTRIGAPIYSADTANPSNRLAMQFAGGGARYQSSMLPSTASEYFLIEAWVNPDTDVGFEWIVYNGEIGVDGWGLARGGDQWYGFRGDTAGAGCSGVVPGQWTHVALGQHEDLGPGGQFTRTYVNGIDCGGGHGIVDPPSPGPNSGFVIGAGLQGQGAFTGRIDEVRIVEFPPGTLEPCRHLCNLLGISTVPLDPPLFADGFEAGNLLSWSAWPGGTP